MSDIEKRLNNIEAHLSINQTITRYCRSLDWLDEELLRTCYTQDAYIDYGFYITNQIMKPVLQIYSLVLFQMPQFQKRKKMFQRKINRLKRETEEYETFLKKQQQWKDKEVEAILFEKYLRINANKANNNTMITSFCN